MAVLIPNAGPECEVDGVNLPFHGEWSRTHVDVLYQSESMVRVRAGTRLPITVTREIALRANPDRLEIVTSVENPTADVTSFIWGSILHSVSEPEISSTCPHQALLIHQVPQ